MDIELWSNEETEKGEKYVSLTIGHGNALILFTDRCWQGEYGKIFQSKILDTWAVSLSWMDFSVRFSDRLGQFTELASYMKRYMYAYTWLPILLQPYIILPVFLRPSAQN